MENGRIDVEFQAIIWLAGVKITDFQWTIAVVTYNMGT